MGIQISLDVNKHDNDPFDGLNKYHPSLRAQVKKIAARKTHVLNVLQSQTQNTLHTSYKSQNDRGVVEGKIISEEESPQINAQFDKKCMEILRQYYEENQVSYVLNILKDKRKWSRSEKMDNNIGLNFKYLNGKANTIVLLKYYIYHQNISIVLSEKQRANTSIVLYCYSIEAFDQQKIPYSFRITLKALINRQSKDLSTFLQQKKQGSGLSKCSCSGQKKVQVQVPLDQMFKSIDDYLKDMGITGSNLVMFVGPQK